jgi:2-hydroxychromene-2-carboxylate isomerase
VRKARFYFSLRSPYSWLAYREILARYGDVAERVDWVPFWEPDPRSASMLAELRGQFPYSAMSRAKHLYILQDVGRLARSRGIPLAWPVDRDPVWEIPHLGYLVASRNGRGPDYIAAAYRARWEEGRNICDRSTIAEIGTALGLDPTELASASDDPALRADGVRILLEVCRDGVFGVPFFVHGYSRYWGLDRLEEFVHHLRAQSPSATAMPAEPVAEVALNPSSDEAHAGGCG